MDVGQCPAHTSGVRIRTCHHRGQAPRGVCTLTFSGTVGDVSVVLVCCVVHACVSTRLSCISNSPIHIKQQKSTQPGSGPHVPHRRTPHTAARANRRPIKAAKCQTPGNPHRFTTVSYFISNGRVAGLNCELLTDQFLPAGPWVLLP